MAIGHTCSLALFLFLEYANMSTAAQADAYAKAVAAVEQGMVEINTDPTQGIAALRAALAELHDFAPQLAHDPAALELRTMAELALARALLASGDADAAAASVDSALESLAGAALPVDHLGPSLGALVDQRERALAARGQARLKVACSVPCRVYVDERLSPANEAEGASLPVGQHRVWIESDEAEPLRTTLTLSDPQAALTLAYPELDTLEPPAPGLVGDDPQVEGSLRSSDSKRAAPRWVEITTLVLGTAAAAAGGVLWALDSSCPGGADPNDVAACPQLYDTRTAGIALVSAGAAVALTGGVMLTVDESRLGDRRGRELALVWTTRF